MDVLSRGEERGQPAVGRHHLRRADVLREGPGCVLVLRGGRDAPEAGAAERLAVDRAARSRAETPIWKDCTSGGAGSGTTSTRASSRPCPRGTPYRGRGRRTCRTSACSPRTCDEDVQPGLRLRVVEAPTCRCCRPDLTAVVDHDRRIEVDHLTGRVVHDRVAVDALRRVGQLLRVRLNLRPVLRRGIRVEARRLEQLLVPDERDSGADERQAVEVLVERRAQQLCRVVVLVERFQARPYCWSSATILSAFANLPK